MRYLWLLAIKKQETRYAKKDNLPEKRAASRSVSKSDPVSILENHQTLPSQSKPNPSKPKM